MDIELTLTLVAFYLWVLLTGNFKGNGRCKSFQTSVLPKAVTFAEFDQKHTKKTEA